MFTIVFSLFTRFGKASGIEPCFMQRSWLSGMTSSSEPIASGSKVVRAKPTEGGQQSSGAVGGCRSIVAIVKPETVIAWHR